MNSQNIHHACLSGLCQGVLDQSNQPNQSFRLEHKIWTKPKIQLFLPPWIQEVLFQVLYLLYERTMQIERSIDARALKKASAVIVSQNHTPGLGLHQKLLSLVLEFNYPSLKETISFRLLLPVRGTNEECKCKRGKKARVRTKKSKRNESFIKLSICWSLC